MRMTQHHREQLLRKATQAQQGGVCLITANRHHYRPSRCRLRGRMGRNEVLSMLACGPLTPRNGETGQAIRLNSAPPLLQSP